MKIMPLIQQYIIEEHPYTVFILSDNKNFTVKDMEKYEITADMVELKNNKIFSNELNQKFETFKDKYLSGKDYLNLPDYSFLRFDITNINSISKCSKNEYKNAESTLCFFPKYLTYRATLKKEYKKRELNVIKNLSKKDILPYIHKCGNIPEVLEENLFVFLSILKDAPSDLKLEVLKDIQANPYYKESHIDEKCDLLNLNKINALHILTAYLKNNMERYELLLALYKAQQYTTLTLPSPYKLIFKQMELIINKLFRIPPCEVRTVYFHKEDLHDFTTLHPNISSEQYNLISQLKLFCELNDLNEKIDSIEKFTRNFPNPPVFLLEKYKYDRQMTIISLINCIAYCLTEGPDKNASPEVIKQKCEDLKLYGLYLQDDKIITQKRIIHVLEDIKNKFPILKDSEEISVKMLEKENSLKFLNEIKQDNTLTIHTSYNHHIKYPTNILDYMGQIVLDTEHALPLVRISFITNKDLGTYRLYELASVCKKFNNQLFSENNIHTLIIQNKKNQMQVDILSLNIDLNTHLQINDILLPIKAEFLFKKLKHKYFLPTYPIQSSARLIDEHLKKNIPPDPKEKSSKIRKGI